MTVGLHWENLAQTSRRSRIVVRCAVLAMLLAAGFPWESRAAGQTDEPRSAVAPLVAPDGQSVAFALVTPARTEIGVVPAIGGACRTLANFAAKAEPVQWFPDGKSLLAVEHAQPPAIWQVPLAGQPRRIVEGENPSLSPDGQVLGWMVGDQAQLMQLATGKAVPADRGPAVGTKLGDWLDDQELIALAGDGGLLRLSISALQSPRFLVPHKSMLHCFVAVAVDRKRRLLAVTSDDMQFADRNNPTSIWIFDAEGKQVGRPIPNASRPQWTDSGQLIFARRNDILFTADFEATRAIAKGESWSISPDEATLFVSRRDVDTNGDGIVNWLDAAQLYRIPLTAGRSGTPQKLAP
jgi:Tol biopolymer transport system component